MTHKAFTKQHYIIIAAAIKDNLNDTKELAKDLAEMFERDNPNFNIVRFMHACGF